MNLLQKIARQIIKKSFNLSVWTISRFHDMRPYTDKVKKYRSYPVGTIGHDLAKCLDDNKLNLVPNYESHDLKHVLLDFKMTPVDEIRMQAFMLGNGNYTFPCFAILFFGAMLLPDEWSTLYNDFKTGRRSTPISTWVIEDIADFQTQDLRQQVIGSNLEKQPILTLKTITKYGAITAIVAGVFGMIFCLPFLFSSTMADLVGAGFSFIGGAILAVGGLLALSNLARTQNQKYV
jgi:hypothetical protein